MKMIYIVDVVNEDARGVYNRCIQPILKLLLFLQYKGFLWT